MTANQINYQNMLVNRATQSEQSRHNMVMESQNEFSNLENRRHNLAVEVETGRHNRVGEKISRKEAKTNRMNAKTNRINTRVNRYNAYTNRYNAYTNRINARTNRLNTQENQRHNKSGEAIQWFGANTDRQQYLVNVGLANNTIKKTNADIVNDQLNTDSRVKLNTSQINMNNENIKRSGVERWKMAEDVTNDRIRAGSEAWYKAGSLDLSNRETFSKQWKNWMDPLPF